MTPPINVPLKLRQLDNDVKEIYETLSSISATQQQHGKRLDAIDTKLETMDTKLETMDTKLETMDTKLETMDTKLETMDTKLETMDTKLDVVIGALNIDVPDDHRVNGSDQR